MIEARESASKTLEGERSPVLGGEKLRLKDLTPSKLLSMRFSNEDLVQARLQKTLRIANWKIKVLVHRDLPRFSNRQDVVETKAGKMAGRKMIASGMIGNAMIGRAMIDLVTAEGLRDAGLNARNRIATERPLHLKTPTIGWTKIYRKNR
jgi:hypothetical protein